MPRALDNKEIVQVKFYKAIDLVELQGKNKTEEIIVYLDNETKRESKFRKFNYRILSIY